MHKPMKPPISYYGGKQRMAPKIIPLIPQHTVLEIVGPGKAVAGKKGNRQYWVCRCECGTVSEYREDALKSGRTWRCRPCSRRSQADKMTRHGGSRKSGRSPEYAAWDAMIQRCTNSRHKQFMDYGERGITVCERWSTFDNFLADMGKRPPGTSIDRVDNDAGYCQENCRWATKKQQQNNRRTNRLFTFDGETMTATQWSERFGNTWNTVRGRISRGWSPYAAFSVPAHQKPGT